MVRVVRGEHACGCGGGVGERGVALEDQYTGTAGLEFQCERKANDPGSRDEDIGCSRDDGLIYGCM